MNSGEGFVLGFFVGLFLTWNLAWAIIFAWAMLLVCDDY